MRRGSYNFLVMPFDATNSPSQFMKLMQNVVRKYFDDFFIIFIHNILIFSHTISEHAKHLRLVFQRLKEQQYSVKSSKRLIHMQKLEFLRQWAPKRGIDLVRAKL